MTRPCSRAATYECRRNLRLTLSSILAVPLAPQASPIIASSRAFNFRPFSRGKFPIMPLSMAYHARNQLTQIPTTTKPVIIAVLYTVDSHLPKSVSAGTTQYLRSIEPRKPIEGFSLENPPDILHDPENQELYGDRWRAVQLHHVPNSSPRHPIHGFSDTQVILARRLYPTHACWNYS